MYGMVNKAIRDYITEHYSRAEWQTALNESEAPNDDFISMQQYPDEVTISLIVAAAATLGKSVDQLLEEIGEYWISFASRSDYGPMLRASGNSLPEVLENLDALHSRLINAFPELKPPSFWCTSDESFHTNDLPEEQNSIILHYVSEREGLVFFVKGLISGLAKMLNTNCRIQHIAKKADGADHDEFLIEYSSHTE